MTFQRVKKSEIVKGKKLWESNVPYRLTVLAKYKDWVWCYWKEYSTYNWKIVYWKDLHRSVEK